MHRGARSPMLIAMHTRTCNMQSPKKSPASVFHFLHLAFWFDPGCWDQNSNSMSPPPLLLCCCCCCCCAAEKHRTTSSIFPTCKISQGYAELKGFVKCCWCCAAPSAAPRSAILPRKMLGQKCSASVFHFLHLAFWFSPGCCDQKQQLHGAAVRRRALTSNLAWV